MVHEQDNALFTPGSAVSDDGLEAVAEDGMPGTLAMFLEENAGVTHYISPGVWVIHTEADPIFTPGEPARGNGLEDIAEDGQPTTLADAIVAMTDIIDGGAFMETVDASTAPPAGPGEAYEFTFTASEGDRLSFVTMLVQSNDLFFAPSGEGLDLFDATGTALSGDVTAQITLWDAGTEVNQEPGVGADQVQRQTGPDTGEAENEPVREIDEVDDGFTYPAVSEVIRVTITPVSS